MAVPAREITAVPLLDELLVIVSCPVKDPAVVGSNCTSRVALCPGFRVRGRVSPEIVKPAPLVVAALIVTAVEPVELNVIG